MKKCTHCKIEKEFEYFNKKTKSPDGYDWKCRDCANKVIRKYRKNPEVLYKQRQYSKFYNKVHADQVRKSQDNWIKNNPEHIRDYHLKRTYGISLDDYNKKFQEQEGCCGICKAPQSDFKKALYLDHCHSTKKARGLLCFRCNLVLGHLDDSLENIEKIMTYLKKYQ